jgi:hypothetical protein
MFERLLGTVYLRVRMPQRQMLENRRRCVVTIGIGDMRANRNGRTPALAPAYDRWRSGIPLFLTMLLHESLVAKAWAWGARRP